MQPLKATFLVVLMVLSSLVGCISGEESEKESEEKIDVTVENETIEQVRDIVAACSGESTRCWPATLEPTEVVMGGGSRKDGNFGNFGAPGPPSHYRGLSVESFLESCWSQR